MSRKRGVQIQTKRPERGQKCWQRIELRIHGLKSWGCDTKLRMTAMGRLGQPEDIADVVALLVSDEARWITGQNVRANGGII
jgi:NAD(P)-dependent dehydrogenase (short-subunit alcohol dehydrogenase family)